MQNPNTDIVNLLDEAMAAGAERERARLLGYYAERHARLHKDEGDMQVCRMVTCRVARELAAGGTPSI